MAKVDADAGIAASQSHGFLRCLVHLRLPPSLNVLTWFWMTTADLIEASLTEAERRRGMEVADCVLDSRQICKFTCIMFVVVLIYLWYSSNVCGVIHALVVLSFCAIAQTFMILQKRFWCYLCICGIKLLWYYSNVYGVTQTFVVLLSRFWYYWNVRAITLELVVYLTYSHVL